MPRPYSCVREIGVIRKLARVTTRLLADTDQKLDRMAEQHKLIQREFRERAALGRETDRRLNALIRALERGGNGRGPSAH